MSCVVSNCGAPSCVQGSCRDRVPFPRRRAPGASRFRVVVSPVTGSDSAARTMRTTLRKLAQRLDACFESRRKRQPHATGNLSLRLLIGTDGKPAHVAFLSAMGKESMGKEIQGCLKRRILSWRLAPSAHRRAVQIQLGFGGP